MEPPAIRSNCFNNRPPASLDYCAWFFSHRQTIICQEENPGCEHREGEVNSETPRRYAPRANGNSSRSSGGRLMLGLQYSLKIPVIRLMLPLDTKNIHIKVTSAHLPPQGTQWSALSSPHAWPPGSFRSCLPPCYTFFNWPPGHHTALIFFLPRW